MLATETKQQQRWKGFTDKQLAAFGVKRTAAGMQVPYFTRERQLYRVKLFPWSGEPRSRWLGANKPQIPYGLWRLPASGDAVVLTEGESDTMALALAFPGLPVLGLPGSQSWEPEWAAYVLDFRRIYLSFDGDPAGDGRLLPDKKAIPSSHSLLGRVRADIPHARALLLPDRADTRDVLQLLGRRAYKVLVTTADRCWEVDRAYEAQNAAFHERRQVEIAWEKRGMARDGRP